MKNRVKKPGKLSEAKTIGQSHEHDEQPVKPKAVNMQLEMPDSDSEDVMRRKVAYAEQPFTPLLGSLIREACDEFSLTPAQVLDVALQVNGAAKKLIKKPDAVRNAEIAAKHWVRDDYENTVQLSIHASATAFGDLSAASVIHKCSVAEALELFVNHSDYMNEWSSGGFVAYPEYVQAEERKTKLPEGAGK